MTIFKSSTKINKSINEVYRFLADMNNHRQLMPDTIQNWSSTVDEANFSIPNMAELALKIENRIPDKEIEIIPTVKPPFDIKLKWGLSADENYTEVLFTIAADLNIMMKMFASGSLKKLADSETTNLYNLLN